MIQIKFKDGVLKGKKVNFNVTCKQLLCTTWDDVDYRWAFKEIARIINTDVKHIESWRVI